MDVAESIKDRRTLWILFACCDRQLESPLEFFTLLRIKPGEIVRGYSGRLTALYSMFIVLLRFDRGVPTIGFQGLQQRDRARAYAVQWRRMDRHVRSCTLVADVGIDLGERDGGAGPLRIDLDGP